MQYHGRMDMSETIPSTQRPPDDGARQDAPAVTAPAADVGGEDRAKTADASSDEARADLRPRVLVVHASVGSGHRSAAIAVAQAVEELRDSPDAAQRAGVSVPPDVEVEVLDILDFGRVRFDGNKTASMFTGITRPVYDLTWRFTFTGRLLWGGGTGISRVMFPKFTAYVREARPLAIVCTHIMAANCSVGARMLTGLDFPILSVPTDYETEGLWPHRQTDLFCIDTESMAETLRPRLVPERNMLITGIPTRSDFRRSYDRTEVRTKLGLPQDKKIVLALAGAHLPKPYVHFREALDQVLPSMAHFQDMHLVIVTGRDLEYAARLEGLVADLELENVTVLRTTLDEMAALMAASDVAICRVGRPHRDRVPLLRDADDPYRPGVRPRESERPHAHGHGRRPARHHRARALERAAQLLATAGKPAGTARERARHPPPERRLGRRGVRFRRWRRCRPRNAAPTAASAS